VRILGFFKKLFNKIIDFIFPPSCPLCGATVSVDGELCGDCWSCFNWIDGPICARCGYPLPTDFDKSANLVCPNCSSEKCELDFVRAACVYDEMSRTAVLPFKHCGKIKYSKFMSRAMIWALRDVNILPDVIMPVPLANRRLFHRGYNQATLLARPISVVYNAKLDVDSVRRTYRENMGHKTSNQRYKNIHGVFNVVNQENIRGKKILLVDDVMTSGATFAELCRVLRRAGASAVYGVVFCRVVRAD